MQRHSQETGQRPLGILSLLPHPSLSPCHRLLAGPPEPSKACILHPQTPLPAPEKEPLPMDYSKQEASFQFTGKQEMPPRV